MKHRAIPRSVAELVALPPSALMTPDECLALAGIQSKRTLSRWVASGRIPAPIFLSALCKRWVCGEFRSAILKPGASEMSLARIKITDKRPKASKAALSKRQPTEAHPRGVVSAHVAKSTAGVHATIAQARKRK